MHTVKVVGIIQARMASSRLPGKVLKQIGGRPMLAWVVERARQSTMLQEVVVATGRDPSDNPVADFCKAQGYLFTRGSSYDVLDRYYQTARQRNAGVIARITADCPLLDPGLIDQTVRVLFNKPDPSQQESPAFKFDLAANRLPPPWGRTTPIGMDIEVCTIAALETAWREGTELYHREHVLPFLYEGIPPRDLQPLENPAVPAEDPWYLQQAVSPRGFRVALLHHHPDASHLRWTVDTPEDLNLVREMVTRLPGDHFTWLDAAALFEREPELAQINASVRHKTVLEVDRRASQDS